MRDGGGVRRRAGGTIEVPRDRGPGGDKIVLCLESGGGCSDPCLWQSDVGPRTYTASL